MSAAFGLLRLQRVDSRVTEAETRLQQIQAALENDAEVEAARRRLQEAESDWQTADDLRRAAEQDAASQRLKIQQAEASLYGGKVSNPKELQDLQADVASLKKQLAAIEDRELAALENLEASEKQTQGSRGELDQLMARRSDESRVLLQEQTDLQGELVNLRIEREAAASAIAGPDLQAYDVLRANHGGLAVAEVAEGACSACGTMLTPAQQQSVRHSPSLVNCPTCGRILHAG